MYATYLKAMSYSKVNERGIREGGGDRYLPPPPSANLDGGRPKKRLFGGRKMKSKMLAVVTAMMMLAVSGIAIANISEDSDATAMGSFDIYMSTDLINWGTPQTVGGNDAAQAIMNTTWWHPEVSVPQDGYVVDSLEPLYVYYGSYPSVSNDYGTIYTFNGKVNGDNDNVWNVFVYQDEEWVIAQPNIGYYKCFTDYTTSEDINWQTANIALYYGPEVSAVPNTLPTANLKALTNVNNSNFLMTFNIKIVYPGVTPTIYENNLGVGNDVTVSETVLKSSNGLTVTGYGSDAYLALLNAVRTNFTGYGEVPADGYYGYGWMDTLFGLTTDLVDEGTSPGWEDDVYAYWIIYTSSGAVTVSDFNLGLMGIAGSAYQTSSVALVYDAASM